MGRATAVVFAGEGARVALVNAYCNGAVLGVDGGRLAQNT
jgi:hypothetical protein